MSIDSACPPPADEFKIPTLRRGNEFSACDRTDYKAAEDLSFYLGSNKLLRSQAFENSSKGLDAQAMSAAQLLAQQAFDLNQYRQASQAVVRVNLTEGETTSPRGSAFGVGAGGDECLYITDFHVASDESSKTKKLNGLSINTPNNGVVEARVRNLDADHDLALLSVPAAKIGVCESLPISSQKADTLLAKSDRIVTVGHPHGSDKQFISAGIIDKTGRTHAQIDEREKPKFWAQSPTIEANLQVIGGMSGGPGMADGVVVGVVQSRIGDTRAVLTPAEYVQSFLAQSLKTADSGGWCQYEKTRQEVEALRTQGKVTSVMFDGSHGRILKHYLLSSGERIDFDDKKKICERLNDDR